MRVGRVPLLCLVLILGVMASSPAMARAGRGAGEDRIAQALVQGINAERQARGLAPLQWASDSYAQQRAEEQPVESTDHHAGFSAKAAADALGLSGSLMTAEAIYWGPAHGAGDAVRGWMNSSTHRDLLMHAEMTLLAVGVRCRDGAMHAIAHVGSSTARDIPATPADPVVTAAGGERCKKPAPQPDPEPEPEPDPEPEHDPAPRPKPAPAPPDPEPEALQEIVAGGQQAPVEPEPSETPTATEAPSPPPLPPPTDLSPVAARPQEPPQESQLAFLAGAIGLLGVIVAGAVRRVGRTR